MGQRSPKAMKWAKEAQNSTSTSPMIVLGYWNLAEGKYTTGPKEAKFAINSLWDDSNKTTTRMKKNFFFFAILGGSWICRKKENDLPKESKDWNNRPAKKKKRSIHMWVVKQPTKENCISFRIWIVGVIHMLRGLNVDTHFLNPCPKSHTEENPMKSKAQRPTKKTEEQERSKERSARERDLQQNTNLS